MVNTEKTPESTPATVADVRRIMRGWVRGVAAAFAVLVLAIAFTYYTSTHEASQSRETLVDTGRVALVTGCNRDFHTQGAFVDLLRRLDKANAAQYATGKIPIDQRAAASAFYKVEIAKAEELVPDCRVVEDVLTDDPNIPLPELTPLHK